MRVCTLRTFNYLFLASSVIEQTWLIYVAKKKRSGETESSLRWLWPAGGLKIFELYFVCFFYVVILSSVKVLILFLSN